MGIDAERNADAEHWESMREIYGAIEGVDYPGRRIGDEILFGGTFGV